MTERQLAERVVRSLQGRASAVEERRLARWRRMSPANEARYRELARIWQIAGLVEPAVAPAPQPSATEVLARQQRAAEAGAPTRAEPAGRDADHSDLLGKRPLARPASGRPTVKN